MTRRRRTSRGSHLLLDALLFGSSTKLERGVCLSLSLAAFVLSLSNAGWLPQVAVDGSTPCICTPELSTLTFTASRDLACRNGFGLGLVPSVRASDCAGVAAGVGPTIRGISSCENAARRT